MLWSQNFIEQKKLLDYEKIYKIKYLNTERLTKNDKYKDQFVQKDFDSPKRSKHVFSISKKRNHTSHQNNPSMNYSQASVSENKSIEAKNNKKGN